MQTNDDNSQNTDRGRDWRHTRSEVVDLRGIEGCVPLIDPEAKGIILVQWLCEKQEKGAIRAQLSALLREYGMMGYGVCVCALQLSLI